MAKQNRIIIRFLIALSVAGIGIAVWENYELRMAHNSEKKHVTQMALRGAYFISTIQQQIDTFNKENSWDDVKTRDSFLIWLAYANESLVGANWSFSHFPSQVSFQDSTNMNDISLWYSDWWGDAVNILGKPGPLTREDKARISQLSNIVSKVDNFYVSLNNNDWDGISAQFAELHTEWEKVKEKQ
ncbi:hypothetical protein MUG84_15215 [Paenibacillus sp. KQZ6P-2]|uniref:Uncharacterized protein n=1 Tax=Paenibacillus mangrovi TaxID=2931978 RepID=A0A9X1WT54_9BACL|nr:hypothetical protein [Paenibacillus mangrovi]MCJ8013085.1 hypothetical protein [Paenibacillus mangrovi]